MRFGLSDSMIEDFIYPRFTTVRSTEITELPSGENLKEYTMADIKAVEERVTKLQEEMQLMMFGACISTVEQPPTTLTMEDIKKAIDDLGPPPPVYMGCVDGKYYFMERDDYDKVTNPFSIDW